MACGGTLTAMTMTAGASLLSGSGTGLTKSLGLDSAITKTSTSFPGFGTITEAISAADGAGGAGLVSMGGLSFPGIGNAVPTEFQSSLGNATGMTGLINSKADAIMGSDLGVFTQHFNSADGLVAGSNQFITSLTSFAGETFSSYSQNSLMTSAFADTNLALPDFGADLVDMGNIVDLNDLSNLGNPLSLVKNLSQQAGGIAVLNKSLLNAGINPDSLNTLVTSTDVSALTNETVGNSLGSGGLARMDSGGTGLSGLSSLTASTDSGLMKTVYEAMGNVTNEDLDQVQAILGSDVKGLTSMQDMLDPSKIMPRSYPSLTSIAPTGKLTKVYT
jgi:hypothetical protein